MIILTVVALALGMLLVTTPAAQAQDQMQAGGQAQKLAALAKQLNLSPEQKMQLMPILKDEAPKVEAIKSNTSLTGMQKMEQLAGPPRADQSTSAEQFCRRSNISSCSKCGSMKLSR